MQLLMLLMLLLSLMSLYYLTNNDEGQQTNNLNYTTVTLGSSTVE